MGLSNIWDYQTYVSIKHMGLSNICLYQTHGIINLGFLSPIEDFGLLNYVDTYCGVSIGAIISLLIISGYQIREIINHMYLLITYNH